ncbi:MAG: VOC family protein [Pseudomonadota bacterium]
MSPAFTTISQFSYVVKDIDRAIDHWAGILRVGPFFVLEHVPYDTCLFRGEVTDVDMSVAMAYSGDTQIELVCQHNNADSIFIEHLQNHGEGLQHVGARTENLDADLSFFQSKSITPVQEGLASNGTRFAYLNTDAFPGTMLELFQIPDDIARAFDYMRKAAKTWDPEIDSPRR